MSDLWPVIYPRDLTQATPITPANVQLAVQRYSNHVFGGPERCTLKASGGSTALFELIELLRCPIEIHHRYLGLVWWGYIAKIVVNVGAIEVGVALDSMSNNIAVAYSYVAPGSATVGERRTTAYSSDADSAGEYGAKDLLLSLGGATDAQALQVRETLLAQNRYPVPYWQKSFGRAESTASLECRGWWDTLNWRMFARGSTGSVETTTQIANAVTAVGQFMAATEILNVSGISTSEYRDGDTTALAEVEELLTTGTTGGLRLRSHVTPERVALVVAEPARGAADWLVSANGDLADTYNNLVQPAICPVGVWLRLKDVIPASADVSKMANPSTAFIERAEYDALREVYLPTPRGVPSPWDIGKLIVRA